MRVKVQTASGEVLEFDSNEVPVLVIFSPGELEQVRSMAPGLTRYLVFPDSAMTTEQAQEFIRPTGDESAHSEGDPPDAT